VQGVHFDSRLTPEDVGFKAVAVSVSDLGSMGATPAWMTLALCLPRDVDADWVQRFARGLGEAARTYNVSLVGGDTTRSPGPILVSVTMGGPLVADPLTRSGGRAGHDLWITGSLGIAAEGWLNATPGAPSLEALRRPAPPLAFALGLAERSLASAAMDLSDGLLTDLRRLCAASGVGAEVDPDRVPGSSDDTARLAGGDDYELLFTAPPDQRSQIQALAQRHGTDVTLIGALTQNTDVRLIGRPWPAPAWRHFGGDP